MRKIVYLSIICLTQSWAFSQNPFIGRVLDHNSNPMNQAVVFLDTIKAEVDLNHLGLFKVSVPNAVKTISVYTKEYGLMTASYNGESSITFRYLDPKTRSSKSPKIDLGYGEVKDEQLTYGVSELDFEKDKNADSFNNIYDYIRGRVSGVVVTGNNRIRIRGANSINSFGEPLFIFDGNIIDDIDFIDVTQVKSITFLKDASASIYGSEAANGVLIIKSKD